MPRTYKICSPYVPSAKPRKSSAEVAAAERVDNIRVVPLTELAQRTGRSSGLRGTSIFQAAFEKFKLWDNGKTLRVKFVDGTSDVQAKVESISKEWEQFANLTLRYVKTGASEIRISFADKGFSWSTVGTDALTVPSSEATMNYGWLEPNTQLREYQRVVRHEFGHALGMIHEHQNPAALGVIPWDKPKVYAYYLQQGWDKATVDHNIFEVYSEDSTNHTAFDPTSIMEYAIPDSLTIGTYSIGWNTELSQLDKDFMGQQYPKGGPVGTQEIVANGARVEADLTNSGEVDTYHFAVADSATHIMTTRGPSDTVLSVHGPNDPGVVLAWDDDRGQGANSRIVRKLEPGDYWLSVRHKDPAATGVYSVGVTTRKR